MEYFNNSHMYCICENKKQIPTEIETMYFNKYGYGTRIKFIKTIKRLRAI